MWPVEEIGKNSVMPSTMERMMACKKVTIREIITEFKKVCNCAILWA